VLQVGEVIGGRFRIDRVIGVGGFGEVAAATHVELRQPVAIKIMKDELVGDTEIIERFLREARAVAVLRTDHVCRVLDVARTDDGTPYIVMDLLDGSDVGAMLKKAPLPVATAVDFAVQACVALAEAHPRGIVHRDLKPPNLFVTRRADGSSLVKLLDFGVAKAADELRLTHSMAMLGSPQYMSPEQLTTPKDVDARTDIWSLGVTLYQMISGRLPFPSAQIGELAVMITTQPPAPIDVAPGLRAVIMRCLEKDRSARFPDVGALAAALAPFGATTTQTYATLAGSTTTPLGTVVGQTTPPYVAASGRRRVLLLAPLALALVGGALAGTYFLVRDSSAKEPGAAVEPAPTEAALAPVETKPTPAAAPATAPAPAIAPVVAAPVVTAPVVTAPVVTAPVEATPPAPVTTPAPVLAQYAAALANTEQQITTYANDPALLQNLYLTAVGMACALKDASKARMYFAKMTNKDSRKDARDACSAHGISLEGR